MTGRENDSKQEEKQRAMALVESLQGRGLAAIAAATAVRRWSSQGYLLGDIETALARTDPSVRDGVVGYVEAILSGRGGGFRSMGSIASTGQINTDTHDPSAAPPSRIWVKDKGADCERCDLERKGYRHVGGTHTCGHVESSAPMYAAIHQRRAEEARENGYCERCTGVGWVQQYATKPPWVGATGFADAKGIRYAVPCGCES